MSRLTVSSPQRGELVMEELHKDLERRLVASPLGLCPVDMASAFLQLCHAQTCGKCVPCRIGLGQLQQLLENILDGNANLATLELLEETAQTIYETADCAIGYQAAEMVLQGIAGFPEEYLSHVQHNRCASTVHQAIPCVSLCPAGVDIPGYVALVGAKQYADSVRLIRNDNPFPAVCAFICEHPCEERCRRNMIDSSINIRGLKRFAVDKAGSVPPSENAPSTGKKIAVIGGGPGGLTTAYFLQLMGHQVSLFEKRKHLGGMLRYGIPSYRLPRERLQEDIDHILATGVEVHTEWEIGEKKSLDSLKKDFDAVYIALGAHGDKKTGIPGEDSRGVLSAVDMLGAVGDYALPDFTDKKVIVIGGGNVAMDVARSAVRFGASNVKVAYRRRLEDMTALADEIEGAVAEGCDILELHAPLRIETDADDNAVALWVQPQITGLVDSQGRSSVRDADLPEVRLDCDIIIVAIGQDIASLHFEESGIPVKRGALSAMADTTVVDGIFAGGDCVTGPSTVIRAIAAGKAAAANMDHYLGFNHVMESTVEIPLPEISDKPRCGRVNLSQRLATERKEDLALAELSMTEEEASQESARCLRCDHYGLGVFKGGRVSKW